MEISTNNEKLEEYAKAEFLQLRNDDSVFADEWKEDDFREWFEEYFENDKCLHNYIDGICKYCGFLVEYNN